MATQYITTPDGVRIAYDISGDGPDMMLLHGAGKTRKDWRKTGYIDRLTGDFRVINVDIRGSGDSEILTGIEDYRIEKIVQDLDWVADACGVERMLIWGYSFGGNIARYLGAWSQRVTGIAVIGVPFGPAVDPDFDRYIDTFIEKYGPLAEAYGHGNLSESKRKSAIKGRIPVWVACFQAMRDWPDIEPEEVMCPALLVAGNKNRSVMDWLQGNQDYLDSAGVQVEILPGLTHPQEFSKIDQVFPAVRFFLGGV